MLNPHVTNKLWWTSFPFSLSSIVAPEAAPLRPVSSSPETSCWPRLWKMSHKASVFPGWLLRSDPLNPWRCVWGNNCFSYQLSNLLQGGGAAPQTPLGSSFLSSALFYIQAALLMNLRGGTSACQARLPSNRGGAKPTNCQWMINSYSRTFSCWSPFRKVTRQWLFNCIL